VKVVVRKNFVGVVAQKPWQAMQAAAKLKVTWNPGAPLPDQASIYDSLRKQPARDTLMVDSGDVDQKLSGAASVLKATYLHPYQMHGSMGSSCAVADVQGEKATIYSATQAVWYQKSTSAMILGLKPENIRVIFRRGSGCYGVNGADTVTYDAAVLSQAVGKPVRVQLTRKDEMAFENYGPAYVIDQRAAVDAQGNIVAWDHESWSPGLGNRPGTNRPGNIITGSLLGFPPADFAPRSPAPAPAQGTVNNNSNAVPSYLAQVTGTVKSGRVSTHAVESRFWTGPLRSPARTPRATGIRPGPTSVGSNASTAMRLPSLIDVWNAEVRPPRRKRFTPSRISRRAASASFQSSSLTHSRNISQFVARKNWLRS